MLLCKLTNKFLIISQLQTEPFARLTTMSNPKTSIRVSHSGLRQSSIQDSFNSSSPSSKRKLGAMFLTQKRTQSHEAEIIERHAELNNYIDKIDDKIQKIVENNEAELLFAYKNHLTKVKTEMQEFKQSTLAQVSSELNYASRIDTLQKQLLVFRDEALKLFDQMTLKDKIIEEQKLKIGQLEAQKRYMDDHVKAVMKRLKDLELKSMKADVLEKSSQHFLQTKPQKSLFLNTGVNYFKLFNRQKKMKDRTLTTSINRRSKQTNNSNFMNKTQTNPLQRYQESAKLTEKNIISRKIKLRFQYLDETTIQDIIKTVEDLLSETQLKPLRSFKHMTLDKEDFEPKQTRLSMRTRSNYTQGNQYTSDRQQSHPKEIIRNSFFSRSKSYYKNLELTDYFKKCVETVKKEIAIRTKNTTANFYKDGNPINIEQFKKIDFFRLTQLVFSNDKVIQNLYASLLNTTQ